MGGPRGVKVTVDVPRVLHKGMSETDADYYRNAARRLRGSYPVGGSNLREAVAQILDQVVEQLQKETNGWA